jgi:hypothetical protein
LKWNIHKLNNVCYQCKFFHKWSPILFMSHVDNWYRTQTIFNFKFFEHGSNVSPLYNENHRNQDGNNVPFDQLFSLQLLISISCNMRRWLKEMGSTSWMLEIVPQIEGLNTIYMILLLKALDNGTSIMFWKNLAFCITYNLTKHKWVLGNVVKVNSKN